jgi:cell cycle arrest protein BUB3
MAHRIIRVIKLPDLAASTSMDIQDGQDFSAAALQKREGALKFLTRSVAVMNDGKGMSADVLGALLMRIGWVSSSIEGRIAVEYFGDDAAIQAKKYAFRAHRQTVGGEDLVYPINAVAYHPT